MLVGDHAVAAAATPLNATVLVDGAAPKSVPVRVTLVPTGPAVGVSEVSVGVGTVHPVPGIAIWIGTSRVVCDPSPSCPCEFAPQAHTDPSRPNASECVAPAPIATIAGKPFTCTGVVTSLVAPFPICPEPPLPHAHTVRSVFNASPCAEPAAICTTFVRPETVTGVVVCPP